MGGNLNLQSQHRLPLLRELSANLYTGSGNPIHPLKEFPTSVFFKVTKHPRFCSKRTSDDSDEGITFVLDSRNVPIDSRTARMSRRPSDESNIPSVLAPSLNLNHFLPFAKHDIDFPK